MKLDEISQRYRQQLMQGITEAQNLGFDTLPVIKPFERIKNTQLEELNTLCNTEFLHKVKKAPSGYWGTSCIPLSRFIHEFLTEKGFKTDIVIGEVEINTTLEYDTTLEYIRKEYTTQNKKGEQTIHAWVSLGDDTVIDAALPDRMIKFYKCPPEILPEIIVSRASLLYKDLKVKHIPMVVGEDFIAKTTPTSPFTMMSNWIQRKLN